MMRSSWHWWRVVVAAGLFIPQYACAAESTVEARKLKVLWGFYQDSIGESWPTLSVSIGLTILASFFLSWLLAWRFSDYTISVSQVIRYYAIHLFASLGLVAVGGLGLWICIASQHPGAALVLGAILVIGLAILAFALPMKYLELGFARTLAFNMVLATGGGLIEKGVSTLTPSPFEEFAKKSGKDQEAEIQAWDMKHQAEAMEAQMARNAPPPPATALEQAQALQFALQKERAALDVNDQPSVQRFNQRVAAYNAAKARLKQAGDGLKVAQSSPPPKSQ